MHQTPNLTYEQKVAMYQQVDKKELIEMLINANNLLDNMARVLLFDANGNVEAEYKLPKANATESTLTTYP